MEKDDEISFDTDLDDEKSGISCLSFFSNNTIKNIII